MHKNVRNLLKIAVLKIIPYTYSFIQNRFYQSWVERLFGQIRPYFEIFCFQLMMLILSKPLRNSSLSLQNQILFQIKNISLSDYMCKIVLKHKWKLYLKLFARIDEIYRLIISFKNQNCGLILISNPRSSQNKVNKKFAIWSQILKTNKTFCWHQMPAL